MLASKVLVTDQVPPPTDGVYVFEELTHGAALPLIVPALGRGLTVINLVAVTVGQKPVTETAT